MSDERYRRGLETRRRVLGDGYVDRALASVDEFSQPFHEWLTASGWGDIWSRPGLDLRTRSLITIASAAALGRSDELAIHIRAALDNGCTAEELSELFLHTALYCGVALGADAMAVATEVLKERHR